MQVAIGSYDGLVAGYQLERNLSSEKETFKFVQKFNDATHLGCVKSLAVSSKGILASGSTDETIHLFNLERSVYVGSLVSHEGDITCLKYVGKDFLYSGSADGTIRMWRTRIWELQRTFKGHKGSVLNFDVHSSKKLAFSVGTDKKLIAWDLVAGKYSFIRNMKKVCDAVVFSPSGSRYAIRSGSIVEIYNLTTTDAVFVEDLKCHVNDVAFVNEDVFVTASDEERVSVFDIASSLKGSSLKGSALLMHVEGHKGRVRSVVPVSTASLDTFILFTSSSDETIKAWSLNLTQRKSECLASVTASCRITSMAVHAPAGSADRLLTTPPPPPAVEVEEGVEVEVEGDSTSVKKKKSLVGKKSFKGTESGKTDSKKGGLATPKKTKKQKKQI